MSNVFLKKVFFKILKGICSVYVELFRDTPMIVQAMVLYYGLRQANTGITPLVAGVLVTVLNTGYIVEDAPPTELFINPKNVRTREFLSRYLAG